MKRAKQIFFHSLLQTNFVSNLIMEDLIDIFTVLVIIPFVRSSCHAQEQLRFKIINDLGVDVVRTMVCFIQNNAIKIIRLVLKQMCISIQSFYCCKNIVFLIFIGTGTHKAHGNTSVKYLFIRFPLRLLHFP